MGRLALEKGARALLLPMPYFFPYTQDDLACFCATVAAELAPAPVLLYNLPRFTTALSVDTVRSLLAEVPNLAGIKDSSGSLEILRALSGGPDSRASRIVGDDTVLVPALRERVCDGVVSGVAGVIPELTAFLFDNAAEAGSLQYAAATALLDELIAHLTLFPAPWGLKLVAECRGLAPAAFAQPLSDTRRRQAAEFSDWFQARWSRAEPVASAPARAVL